MPEVKPSTSDFVYRFKKKYPLTIGWRYLKNSSIVEKHLNPGEEVLYAFIAQKNDNPFQIFQSAVVALTNERILIGRKRVIFGYFLDSITPDMFNDLKISGGIIWGKVMIDTVKEFVVLSNISNRALPELHTKITNYMKVMKQRYLVVEEDE
ncbi:MAG: PH domain-containing protein [Bacilli bacterium]|nr:PH domain-containing protein [Bacilli bacterium]